MLLTHRERRFPTLQYLVYSISECVMNSTAAMLLPKFASARLIHHRDDVFVSP